VEDVVETDELDQFTEAAAPHRYAIVRPDRFAMRCRRASASIVVRSDDPSTLASTSIKRFPASAGFSARS
jgi:hypothetical protein